MEFWDGEAAGAGKLLESLGREIGGVKLVRNSIDAPLTTHFFQHPSSAACFQSRSASLGRHLLPQGEKVGALYERRCRPSPP